MLSYIFISVIIHFILLSILRRWFNQHKSEKGVSILLKYLLYFVYFVSIYLYFTLVRVYFMDGYSTTKYVLISTLGTPILVLSLPLFYPIFRYLPRIVTDFSIYVLVVYLYLFTFRDTYGGYTLDILVAFIIYFVELVAYAYKTREIGVSYYKGLFYDLLRVIRGG